MVPTLRKLMTKKKGRQDEKRLPAISGGPEINEASDDIDGEEEPTTTERFLIDLGDDDRVAVRLEIGSWGQLVDFAVVQQTRDGQRWRDVVRYDCSHGDVHLHSFRKGRKDAKKKVLCGLSDIEGGYKQAEDAIFDRWEDNRRRYLNG
jgi:hypothetical protein